VGAGEGLGERVGGGRKLQRLPSFRPAPRAAGPPPPPARRRRASFPHPLPAPNPSTPAQDACNGKSNQQNLGTIKCSNLCTEIVEYTAPDETAVCNLASIALPRFVREQGAQVRRRAGLGLGWAGGRGQGGTMRAAAVLKAHSARCF
jgi:hypothetical protein